MGEELLSILNFFLHLDKELATIIALYGTVTYLILFAIIFCETGLVITPFLPGDSLLFAAGALTASTVLDINILIILLIIAAILGDATNYHIGRALGSKVYTFKDRWYFKQEYLKRTHSFYEKYGGKTIIIARFVPIVRTFAPFLAGVGVMNYGRFAVFNVTGAILWVCSLSLAGYFFGELAFVKENFSLVILAIIFISILPGIVELIRVKRNSLKKVGA